MFVRWIYIAILTVMTASGGVFASDYATEVIHYVPGSGIGYDWLSWQLFNNPGTALGRPTVDTTDDSGQIGPAVPVVPVSPAYRAFEIVTVGRGGSLVLKFDHPVLDDSRNPYGIDFVVFGNSPQVIDGQSWWEYGDPNAMYVGSECWTENGVVSVSQDNLTWYTFSNGPYADDFAPTLGRVYRPCNPDSSLGAWNLWWGEPTDPTLPLNPSLTSADFSGKSVADVAKMYGRSAGGTGFDIGPFGLGWIQYVKIQNSVESDTLPEVDAVADVSPACENGRPFVRADYNRDCHVDSTDFDTFSACYNGPTNPVVGSCCDADLNGDDFVDATDFDIFSGCYNGPVNLPNCQS